MLTERQRADLKLAVFDYFLAQPGDTFAASIKAFRQDAGLATEQDSGKGILEKKWTSVVRLQKRVMELESKVAELEQSLKNGAGMGGIGGAGVLTFIRESAAAGAVGAGDGRLLPRPPARSTMTGHRAPVICVAVHPVYTLAATGSEDMTIKMWDFDTAQFERTFKGHTGHVTGVAFDRAGNLLASCSADMSAKLWDLATNTCIKTLKGHDHTLSGVQFLPSGDSLVTCSRDQTIKLWETATGYCTKTLVGHTEWVRCLSISLDGEMLASGGSDHCVMLWRLRTGTLANTLRGHEHVVESVSFGRKPVSAADILAAEKAAVAGGGGAGGSTSNGNGSGGGVEADGSFNYLASGSRDRTVRLWDTGNGQCLMTFAAHENWVRCVLFHPSGKFILSCSDDKSIRVLDIKVSE